MQHTGQRLSQNSSNNEIYHELMQIIESQEQVIETQSALVKKLVICNAEKENMIENIFKRGHDQ